MNEEEMDEQTKEALKQVARAYNKNLEDVVCICQKVTEQLAKTLNDVAEKLSDLFESLPDLPRPPAEIKKEIKYEKNPMRLKQLNRELNESYKTYRKKGRKP